MDKRWSLKFFSYVDDDDAQCDQMLEEKVAIAQNVTKGALNQKVMFFILANEVTKYLGYFC